MLCPGSLRRAKTRESRQLLRISCKVVLKSWLRFLRRRTLRRKLFFTSVDENYATEADEGRIAISSSSQVIFNPPHQRAQQFGPTPMLSTQSMVPTSRPSSFYMTTTNSNHSHPLEQLPDCSHYLQHHSQAPNRRKTLCCPPRSYQNPYDGRHPRRPRHY